MALNKKNKGIAKKAIAKKPAPKKQVKKAVPLKKASAKKIAKKPVAGRANTASKTVAKRVKATSKFVPVKKASKPVAKKAAAKKPVSKKSAVPIKKGNAPIDKKHMTETKRTPKKEQNKKTSSKARGTKTLPKAKDIKVPAPPQVVLPKITTTKARKYEPEFTKSVLDQAPQESNGPTQRYSDAELNEFKELIQRKLETAKKELAYLQGLITRKDEMGGDETDNRYMTMEDGSLSMEREQLSQMASRQITFIDHLEKAMMRIENKTYGICRVTGKLIDKARLRAVPHATLSIEAKMGIVK
jgi:RNA polymerase-binding transcription factor DksA